MRQFKVSRTVVFKPFSNLMTNHEISGVQNWQDLEEEDCDESFKNDFELSVGFRVTRSRILHLYESQLLQLQDLFNPASERSCLVTHDRTKGSLCGNRPTILERYRFADGAESINEFLQAILAQYKRRQWDRSVEDLRLVKPIQNKNMLVMEELSTELVSGYN